jgi:hypothetical protein
MCFLQGPVGAGNCVPRLIHKHRVVPAEGGMTPRDGQSPWRWQHARSPPWAGAANRVILWKGVINAD